MASAMQEQLLCSRVHTLTAICGLLSLQRGASATRAQLRAGMQARGSKLQHHQPQANLSQSLCAHATSTSALCSTNSFTRAPCTRHPIHSWSRAQAKLYTHNRGDSPEAYYAL